MASNPFPVGTPHFGFNEPEKPKTMTEMLIEPLNELQSLSQTLFLSLAPAQTRPPPPPPIEAFIQADAKLAIALQHARIHQMNQRKIEALMEEVLELEGGLKDVCAELERGKSELAEMIEEGDERVKAAEKAKKVALPYNELLAYAQSVSAFSSAPPNMPDITLPGQPPPPLFFPPFPNEEKMRRGRLNEEAPLGQLGEIHSIGQSPEKSPDKPELQAPLPIGNYPYRLEHPPDQVFDLDLDLNPDI